MPGCGYVCTRCEGSGYLENGNECDVCGERAAWIAQVHEGSCCSDLNLNPENDLETSNK